MIENIIEKIAIISMLKELDLCDKPGLVSPKSCGNHHDMDYFLMRSSIISLKNYFKNAFLIGYAFEFDKLLKLGLKYEKIMLKKTGGINTYKGVIFSLGILCYLVGKCLKYNLAIDKKNLLSLIESDDLLKEKIKIKKMRDKGAKEEVKSGYKLSFDAIEYGISKRLYFIISNCYDKNIINRSDKNTLKKVNHLAKLSLKNKNKKVELKEYIDKNYISPGGSADILINSFFLEEVIKYFSKYQTMIREEILKEKEYALSIQEKTKYLISLSLVFPGNLKTHTLYKKYFDHVFNLLNKKYKLIERRENMTGYRTFFEIQECDFVELKKNLISLEDEYKIIDLDLYVNSKPLDRRYIHHPQRKCILCDDFAKVCFRSKKHSDLELLEKCLNYVRNYDYRTH